MTTWRRKNGDLKDTIKVQIKGLDPLTGLTAATSVEAHVQYGTDTPVTLAAGVLSALPTADSAWPIVLVQLGATGGWLETAKRGCWRLETEITFGDGSQLTWPDEGVDEICVGDDIA